MSTDAPTSNPKDAYIIAGDHRDHQVSISQQDKVTRKGKPARLWRLGRVALLLSIVLIFFYWLRIKPVEVQAYVVQEGEVVAEVLGTGTLEARVKAIISPKISGRLASIVADQGDQVTTGQLLFQLDDEELQQQVEIATASVGAARAGVDRLKADKDRAVAVLKRAEFDYDHTQGLYKDDTAAIVEINRAIEALNIARAELARAEAAIVEGQRDLITEEKSLAYHRARLSDTRINAPFDGLIVRRHRDPGDVVVPGSPVLTLISTDEIWINAWVDETQMAHLAAEQPARVIFRSAPARSLPGRVARLGREADRETREFLVDVRVLELPANWAVGQRAEVYIETARKDAAVLLPSAFLDRRNNALGVCVLENNRAHWRGIVLGVRGRESVEVLEGLQPGDVVLAPTVNRTQLRNGQRITTKP